MDVHPSFGGSVGLSLLRIEDQLAGFDRIVDHHFGNLLGRLLLENI